MKGLLYTFGDNITTLLPRKGIEKTLPLSEALLVGVIANELMHLPYYPFLFDFVQALGCPTKCKSPDQVLNFSAWYYTPMAKPFEGQLCPDIVIELEDAVVFFEFKRMAKTPSQNSMDMRQLGTQFYTLSRIADNRNYKLITVVNTAPLVHIPNCGTVEPSGALNCWLKENGIDISVELIRQRLNCISIEQLQQLIIDVVGKCKKETTHIGVKNLYERASETINYIISEQRKLINEQ